MLVNIYDLFVINTIYTKINWLLKLVKEWIMEQIGEENDDIKDVHADEKKCSSD